MKKFFQLFLFLPRFLAILAAYLLRGKKTLTCTLTTENGYKRSSLLFLQFLSEHDILVISITICWERSRYELLQC